MVGSRRRNHVFRVVSSESPNCYVWRIGVMLFDWRILEPVAIVICGNVRRNGIMWNFRIKSTVMRAKSDKPGDPVKEVAGTVGNVAPDMFPEINEEQQTIIPPFVDVQPGQPTGVFEIIPGMTVEEMTAMFFDEKTLIEPPYKVWQLNSKGHRYYYRYDDAGNPEFFPSVTTILSQTLPKAPHLINWIANKGIEEAERYKGERAAYGTFMHAAFEELLINRAYDLDGLKGKLKEYIEVYRLPDYFIYYADDLKKDVLAFAQFVLDYDVRPLAVEIALVHPYYKYAGMIDCPCTMRAKIGSDDRINAIVDFKSGRKGFYEESEIQLGMYRDMWNVNFEQFPVTRIFNFSPKDWRKKPSYNLKEQTESPNIRKIPYLLEIAAIEDEKRDNTFTAVNGMVVLDDAPDLSQNVISLSLAELIKTKAPKEATPDETTDAADTVKADAVAPEQTPEPEIKKTKIVKRTGETAKEAKKKPDTGRKTEKRTVAPEKEQKPANALKKPKNENKKRLLNDDPEI